MPKADETSVDETSADEASGDETTGRIEGTDAAGEPAAGETIGDEAEAAVKDNAGDAAAENGGEPENGGRAENGAKPDDGQNEKPKPPASMLDVFRGLKVGDWARTRWTNKEEHTLLVAARTDKTITIEEIVEDRGFRKSWTQMDVALEDGSLLALRVRLPDGSIEEREPAPNAQRGTSDLLAQKFRRDGQEQIRIPRIEVFKAGVKEPEIKRGLFQCQRYKITVEKNRWARLWFSKVKLPDYPVKISYPEENLGIVLEAFGSGRESTFDERQ